MLYRTVYKTKTAWQPFETDISILTERTITVMGLGTAATTIPIAGCEDNKAGLPEVILDPGPGVPASALLA